MAIYRKIWTATYEWLEIAEKQGLEVEWDADPISGDEWDEVCGIAEVDAEDYEVGFAKLVSPRDCDTLLKAGDLICTTGAGGDVEFLREVTA